VQRGINGFMQNQNREMPMTGQIAFEEINKAKTNLDDIYNQPDPRAYCGRLRKLDYVIPDVAKPIFRKLISEVRQRRGDPVNRAGLFNAFGALRAERVSNRA
jgi:hypothetical protein